MKSMPKGIDWVPRCQLYTGIELNWKIVIL
jgi:hypothetical protein